MNRKLVGYDVVGNTQFEVDATSAAVFGGGNRLDVRITDAGGNFSWPAHTIFQWGKYWMPIVRGFGGVTGDVTVRAVDPVAVSDVWVLNTPKITDAKVTVALANTSDAPKSGKLTLIVHEYKNPSVVVWKKAVSATIPAGAKEITLECALRKAKIWGLFQPNSTSRARNSSLRTALRRTPWARGSASAGSPWERRTATSGCTSTGRGCSSWPRSTAATGHHRYELLAQMARREVEAHLDGLQRPRLP